MSYYPASNSLILMNYEYLSIFIGSVLSGTSQNAEESSRVMEDIIAAVPRLLERMRSSDFLPVPCLNVTAPLDEKETSSSGAGCIDSKPSIEKTGEEETSFDEPDEDEDDDDDDDNDNDDDTNPNTPDPIYAENIPKVVVHDMNLDQRYRINPLVKIITSTDIKQFQRGASSSDKNHKDSDSDSQAYIVHAGYGNETFESVLRQVVIVPKAMELSAVLLASAITLHQKARQRTYEFEGQRSTKKRGRDHEVSDNEWHSTCCVTVKSIACITKKSKGLVSTPDPLQLTRQLLDAFVLAGALTLED